jgi:O-antigen/teichoic acid export membrane protein
MAITILATRLLGPTLYGSLALGLSVVGLVGVVSRLGLGMAVARTVAAQRVGGDAKGVVATAQSAFSLVGLTSIFAIVVVVVLIYSGQSSLAGQTRLILGLGLGALLLAKNTAGAAGSLNQGLGRMVLMEVPNLSLVLLQLLAVVVLWTIHVADLRGIAIGYGLAGVAVIFGSAELSRRAVSSTWRLFRPAPRAAVRLIRMATPYAVAAVATQVIAQFDILVLGFAHSSSVVGVYEPTLRLTDRFLLILPGLVIAPYVPASTRLFLEGEAQTFKGLYIDISKLIYIFSFPLMFALAAFPRAILHTFFGGAFASHPYLVWILLVGYGFNLAFGLNAETLIAAGERRLLAAVYGAAFVAMVGLALGLIPPFGAVGAAFATSTSYVVLNIGMGWALFRRTRVHPFRLDMVLVLLSSLGLFGLAPLFRSLGLQQHLVGACLVIAVVWGLWVALLMAIGTLRPVEVLRLIPYRRTRHR